MQRLKLVTILISILMTANSARAEIINKILAQVGNTVITQYEVESFNPKKLKEIYAYPESKEREQGIKLYYKNVLDFLVAQYTMEAAAKREGISVDKKEVNDAVTDILKRNSLTEEQLQTALEKEQITLEQYKWQLKMEIINARLKSKVIAPLIVVTEEDIKKYVNENKESLKLDDRYELRLIYLKSKNDLDKTEALIKSKSFSDAAIQFSSDPTAKSGGYLGWVNYSYLSNDMKNAITNRGTNSRFFIEDDKGGAKLFLIEGYRNKFDIDNEQKLKIVDTLKEARFKKVLDDWYEKHKTTIFTRYIN